MLKVHCILPVSFHHPFSKKYRLLQSYLSCALSLINLLHFTLSFVLSMSGGKEQRYLALSHIEIGGDSSGKDMSTYRKTNQNKTR